MLPNSRLPRAQPVGSTWVSGHHGTPNVPEENPYVHVRVGLDSARLTTHSPVTDPKPHLNVRVSYEGRIRQAHARWRAREGGREDRPRDAPLRGARAARAS